MIENWRDVEGYEGIYQVSDLGRVKSLIGKEKILKPWLNTQCYYRVVLYKDKKKKKFSVHRLVCLNFLNNPENKSDINHKNGVKTDNRLTNLEWVSASENIQHAYDNGLKKQYVGSKHGRSKLTEEEVFQIRESNLTQRELGRIYGVGLSLIYKIKRRKIWTHI